MGSSLKCGFGSGWRCNQPGANELRGDRRPCLRTRLWAGRGEGPKEPPSPGEQGLQAGAGLVWGLVIGTSSGRSLQGICRVYPHNLPWNVMSQTRFPTSRGPRGRRVTLLGHRHCTGSCRHPFHTRPLPSCHVTRLTWSLLDNSNPLLPAPQPPPLMLNALAERQGGGTFRQTRVQAPGTVGRPPPSRAHPASSAAALTGITLAGVPSGMAGLALSGALVRLPCSAGQAWAGHPEVQHAGRLCPASNRQPNRRAEKEGVRPDAQPPGGTWHLCRRRTGPRGGARGSRDASPSPCPHFGATAGSCGLGLSLWAHGGHSVPPAAGCALRRAAAMGV